MGMSHISLMSFDSARSFGIQPVILEEAEMNSTVAQLVLDEIFPALEALETQNGAILQFLTERGIASDADLTPFLEQAAKASSVRWRAARVRADHLLSTAAKAAEAAQEKPRETSKTNDDNKGKQTTPNSPQSPGKPEEHVERAEGKAADLEAGRGRHMGSKEDETRGPEEVKPDKPAGKDAA
jgi:hypothetical protein